MTLRIAALFVLFALGLPAWSSAQGLGDTAARERARRQREARPAEPARQFTNEDLEKGRPAGQEGESSSTANEEAAPAGLSETPGSPREDAPLPSQQLRAELDAVTQARARLSGLEAQIRQLRDKLNPMSGSFIYGQSGSNSPAEEAEVREELTRAEGELAGARQELANAQEALDAAGRRQNVQPPPSEPVE